MTPSERIVSALWQARWVLAAVLVPLIVLAGVGASNVGVDNAVDVWFVEDDPALVAYDRFQETFGNDEVVVLAVTEAGGVISPAGLRRVDWVTGMAEQTDGIVEVVSLTNLDHIRLDENWVPSFEGEAPSIFVGALIDVLPETPADAATLQARVMEDPLVRGRLVSEDGTTALVLARMDAFEGSDARRDEILIDLEGRLATGDQPVAEAGIGVIFSALNRASTRDALVVGAASYVVILILLGVLFGRAGPVILTISVVGVAALFTMGLYGGLHRDMNMVTMALPTLVLIIGVADCVHVLHRVAAQPSGDQGERIRAGVGAVLWPCLFTSLTTAAGFLGLATARMQVVRDLGWFAAAGVLLAFAVSFIVVIAALRWRLFEPKERSGHRLQSLLVAIGDLAMARRREVLGVAVLAVLAGALGISKLDVDTYSIDYFYPSHPVRADSEEIEEAFGPYTPLEMVIRSDDTMRTSERLTAIAAWQDAMETDEQVGWTHSAADLTRRLNQVLIGGDATHFEVPGDDLALDQALIFYESDPDSRLDDLVDAEWKTVRVTVGLEMMSARDIGKAIDRLEGAAALPPGMEIVPSGYLPLYVTMMDYVVRSQITSFSLAFLLIFALLAALFRSMRMALLAVPANLLPLFITLGLMGYTGIRLDVATVTIAALVLGLVVDDTTHFLYRYREFLRAGKDHEDAVRETLRTTGVAMTITTIVLVVGFSVLGLATVKSVAFFGLLSAVAMGAALVGDLVMMPALMVTLRPDLR